MANEDERVEAIADAIEHYLRAHPDAADSIEGIQLWWLTGDVAEETAERIREAIDRLEAAGLVARHDLPGRRVVYGAARQPR